MLDHSRTAEEQLSLVQWCVLTEPPIALLSYEEHGTLSGNKQPLRLALVLLSRCTFSVAKGSFLPSLAYKILYLYLNILGYFASKENTFPCPDDISLGLMQGPIPSSCAVPGRGFGEPGVVKHGAHSRSHSPVEQET